MCTCKHRYLLCHVKFKCNMNFLCKVYLRTIYNLQLQYIDLIAELLRKFHDCYKILLLLQINFKYMLHIFLINFIRFTQQEHDTFLKQ